MKKNRKIIYTGLLNSFRNYSKSRKSQAIVEYIALLIITLSLFLTFLTNVKNSFDGYQKGMATKIAEQ